MTKTGCITTKDDICLEEVGSLQILPDNGVQNHFEYDADVVGISGSGEMGVDYLALVLVPLHEELLDETGGGFDIMFWALGKKRDSNTCNRATMEPNPPTWSTL